MLLDFLVGKGLVFLGGKGGVGKTTMSSTIALGLARHGRRVCLVSTDPAHNLGHLFERAIGPHPTLIAPNLSAIELDPEETVTSHLAQVAQFLASVMPRGGRAAIEKHLEQSRHTPGMADAALLEKLADLAEGIGRDYDHLILDTAPTGHTLTLLSLPEMMAAWTDGMIANRLESDRFNVRARALASGRNTEDPRSAAIRDVLNRRRERFAVLRQRITDTERTSFLAVTTPERMPVLETLALGKALTKTGIPLGGILVNRVPVEYDEATLAERIAPLRAEWPETGFYTVENSSSEPSGIDGLAELADRLLA